MSSFIIQCNWTRERVYRYLVSQQKHRTQKAANSDNQHAHPLRKVFWLEATRKKIMQENIFLLKRVRACIYARVCVNKQSRLQKLKTSKSTYLRSCIVGISKLRERHSCFFCYHQQYSSPLIDCNQFYLKSTVLHTFPRTAFRSIIDDFSHRRETLGWHQLQIVLYEWIIPPRTR